MTSQQHLHFANMQPFFNQITARTSFGLFILGYFINMDYSAIASVKGASICERSAIF